VRDENLLRSLQDSPPCVTQHAFNIELTFVALLVILVSSNAAATATYAGSAILTGSFTGTSVLAGSALVDLTAATSSATAST
jgi:hypothetical protein